MRRSQARGDVAEHGGHKPVPDGNLRPATTEEIGLTRKLLHEARRVREASVSL
jgi:hypothetical protein